MEAKEVWKPVTGFALKGAYEVSSEGRIRSYLRRGQKGTFDLSRFGKEPHLLSTTPAKDGYVMVALVSRKGPKKYVRLHRLVAEVFLGPRPTGVSKGGSPKWDIDHLNENPSDNRACNLRYVTHAENLRRSSKVRSRAPKRGEDAPTSKLTEKDVIKIRQLASEGWSRRKLGERFSVTNVCITHAVNRKTWKHV